MKKIVLILVLIGIVLPMKAQDPIQLDEIVVKAMNYKYLSAVENSEAPVPIWNVEKEAAMFNVTDSDVYLDDFNMYQVTFRIPDGVMVVAYDQDGEIIKTIERFKNYQLPEDVSMALKDRYPKWQVVKDLFLVTYSQKTGADKMYKIKLKNGKETIRVKMDQNGNFL